MLGPWTAQPQFVTAADGHPTLTWRYAYLALCSLSLLEGIRTMGLATKVGDVVENADIDRETVG